MNEMPHLPLLGKTMGIDRAFVSQFLPHPWGGPGNAKDALHEPCVCLTEYVLVCSGMFVQAVEKWPAIREYFYSL